MRTLALPQYASGPNTFRLFGKAATLLFRAETAAGLQSWTIRKSSKTGHWMLRGTVTRADAFLCAQRGLLFTAPRDRNGWWCWPIERLRIEGPYLKAVLGHPEQ